MKLALMVVALLLLGCEDPCKKCPKACVVKETIMTFIPVYVGNNFTLLQPTWTEVYRCPGNAPVR